MINGSNVIIQTLNGDIVGQMEMTLTFVGAPIDITNKSVDEWIEIFEGELGIKQLQISGAIVYNDDDQYRKVRNDAFNGFLDTYIVSYVSNDITVEMFTATMMPNGLSDAIPHGDKLTTSLTFLSSGPVLITTIEVNALLTTIYPVLAGESTPMAGIIEIDYIRAMRLRFETPLMGGTIEVDEITLTTILIEYAEEEAPMMGVLEIEEITLTEVLILLESTEESMLGVLEIEEITLTEILIEYSENEEAMTGIIEIDEITLTTA